MRSCGLTFCGGGPLRFVLSMKLLAEVAIGSDRHHDWARDIGTIGMEGASEAIWTGTMDLNWAKERCSLWHEEERQAPA